MFAINHAATALVLKRAYPRVSLLWLLLSVQVMELLWVLLNYLGLERTSTEPAILTVADIHLVHMPFSHSVATTIAVAVLLGLLLAKGSGSRELGVAVGIGVSSHLVLDLLTHDRDIALAPFLDGPELGLGLYSAAPLLAFAVEFGYGVLCWRIFRGRPALLAVIVFFNLANLSMFSAAVPGPEQWMADRPMLITTVILAQILATLALVGALARRNEPAPEPSAASAVLVDS